MEVKEQYEVRILQYILNCIFNGESPENEDDEQEIEAFYSYVDDCMKQSESYPECHYTVDVDDDCYDEFARSELTGIYGATVDVTINIIG